MSKFIDYTVDVTSMPHAGDLLKGILTLDRIAYKSAGINVVVRRAEAHLYSVLATTYHRRALDGAANAREAVLSAGAEVDEHELIGVEDAVRSAFAGWAQEAEPLIQATATEIYRTGKQQIYDTYNGHKEAGPYTSPVAKADEPKAKKPGGPKKGSKVLEMKPHFDLVDKSAVDAMVKHQVYWIAKAYDNVLSEKVAHIATDILIKQGLGREEGAKLLETELGKAFGYKAGSPASKLPLPTGFRGNGFQYLEGLASNTATTARVNGSVRGFTELGVTHYQIVNANDERTCPRCAMLDERSFEVEHAAKQVQMTVEAETPDQVRDIHPWPTVKEVHAAIPTDSKKDDAKLNKEIAAKGWSLPPFHYNCRCTVDISEDAVFIPDPVKADDEFPWTPTDLKTVDRSLAGAHAKMLFSDPNGAEWIFKPQDDFRTQGDLAAARLAKLLGQDTAEVYAYKHSNGQTGSIQKVFKGVQGDMTGTPPDALSLGDASKIEREHAFDWLISQHDTHRENILRTEDGIKFIDKGQLFRFFGKDELSLEYGGNGHPNPVETYYHKMFNDYAAGKDVPVTGMKGLESFLKKLDSVSDADYIKALRPYASAAIKAAEANPSMKSAAWMGRYTEEQFLKEAVERKNGIHSELEHFYAQIEAARERVRAPKGRLGEWTTALEDAKKADWRGKTVFVKGSHYEDMSWLMYGTKGDGTFMETKVRPEADRALTTLLGLNSVSHPVVTTSAGDVLHNDVLKIVKSFNFNFAKSGNVPKEHLTNERVKEMYAKLSAVTPSSVHFPMGIESHAQAKHYLDFLDAIWDAKTKAWKKDGVGKLLKKWEPPAKPPDKKVGGLPDKWTVEKTQNSDPIKRQIKDGKITMVSGGSPTQLDSGTPSYKITTDDGLVSMYYRPHSGSNVSAQGHLKVWINKPIESLTPAELDKAFSHLGKVGMHTEFANKDDIELMYLRKLAYKAKLDKSTDSAIPESMGTSEQIAALKKRLVTAGALKLDATYKPEPTFDRADKTGWPRWMGQYGKEEAANLKLVHHLHNNIISDFDNILGGKTKALVPSFEKFRVGIPLGGMSPERDLETGGGSYVFLRIKQQPEHENHNSLVFKGELLQDMSAISHDEDRYGRFSAVGQRRTKDEWNNIARESSNETIFKHDLDLEKWLDHVVVTDADEKATLIKVFQNHGYKTFAGKTLDDFVRISR